VTHEDSPGIDFNHAISAIELPATLKVNYRSVVQASSGQRFLIFDPSNEWIPLGDLPDYEQGNFALLEGADGGELIRLPLSSPQENRFARTGKLTLAADGAVSGELHVSSSGTHAWPARSQVSRENELERTRYAESFLSRWVQGAALSKVEFGSVSQLDQEFTVHYSFSAPSFLKSSGPLLLFQPCVFGHKGIRIDWKKRKYPVDLRTATDEIDSYELALPAGLEVDDLPVTVDIDVGFASYQSKVSVENGVILYRREYIVRDPQVGIEKLGQLRKLEDAITRDESSSVVLKKKN
jgi:hypothetical protein